MKKEHNVKKLVILGAGTAGTMVAAKLRPRLDPDEWSITMIDQEPTHFYQPGYLFIPFGIYSPDDVVKPKIDFIPPGVSYVEAEIDLIEPADNRVKLADGTIFDYDYLVIATGSSIRPDETPGLEGPEYGKTIHDFYTLDGAKALAEALRFWEGGRLVLNIVEMPIKCPVAPLEFMFLADSYFQDKGIRDEVELTYVTPLDGAFTKPLASKTLGYLLEEKGIQVETEFMTGEVDSEKNVIRSYDEREVPYDLLVTVPPHMGAPFLEDTDLADELAFERGPGTWRNRLGDVSHG